MGTFDIDHNYIWTYYVDLPDNSSDFYVWPIQVGAQTSLFAFVVLIIIHQYKDNGIMDV